MNGFLILSIVELVVIACLALLIVLLTKEPKEKFGWEVHPCAKPNATDASMGQIWKCHCGRRWEYRGREGHSPWGIQWRERTAEVDLAEAEEVLRKFGQPTRRRDSD